MPYFGAGHTGLRGKFKLPIPYERQHVPPVTMGPHHLRKVLVTLICFTKYYFSKAHSRPCGLEWIGLERHPRPYGLTYRYFSGLNFRKLNPSRDLHGNKVSLSITYGYSLFTRVAVRRQQEAHLSSRQYNIAMPRYVYTRQELFNTPSRIQGGYSGE